MKESVRQVSDVWRSADTRGPKQSAAATETRLLGCTRVDRFGEIERLAIIRGSVLMKSGERGIEDAGDLNACKRGQI